MVLTIVDTDILIRLAKRHPATLDQAEELGGTVHLATTSLNVAEFLRGIPPAADAAARAWIGGLPEIPFGPRVARRFGQLMHALDRAGRPVPMVDGLVAAVALEEGAQLWTANRRHFGRIAGLHLVP